MTSRESGLPKNIVLTGATGTVGGRILMEILCFTSANCYCLVRAGDEISAHKRLSGILKFYGMPDSDYERYRNRILPVLGDITLADLGLNRKTYDLLAENADLVVHMAADINLVGSYRMLYAANVGGTEHMIDFCLQSGCRLAYGSTYAVVGDHIYRRGYVFKEDALDIGQEFSESLYERTKFEAELKLHQAESRGLRLIILRLGDIMGDSRSGNYPLTGKKSISIYYDLLKTVLETGIAPFSEERFYITPVDYAARSILYLALNPDSYGSTFHIVNSDQKHFYQIMNLLVECGYSIRMFPYKEYVQLFKKNRVWLRGKSYRSIFTRMIATLPYFSDQEALARICTRKAERILLSPGIRCAHQDYNLIATYLNFCIQHRYLPSPSDQRPLAEIH